MIKRWNIIVYDDVALEEDCCLNGLGCDCRGNDFSRTTILAIHGNRVSGVMSFTARILEAMES